MIPIPIRFITVTEVRLEAMNLVLVLAVAAPQLATIATRFTSYEYFWLYVLGLTCAAIVSDEARLKGALALLIASRDIGGAVAVEVHAQAPSGTGTRRGALFSPTQLRRLRDWATAQQPRGMIKILAVGAGGDQLRAFHDSLRECADFLTDPRAVRNPGRVEGLTTLGHFTIDDGISLRIVGVPAAAAYAPLLEVAAHGMLGAIVLPKAAFGPGLEVTENAYTRLVELCGRGVFQLILAGAVEGSVDPDQLEGGSVFVLPDSDAEHRLGVLRNLFARIIP